MSRIYSITTTWWPLGQPRVSRIPRRLSRPITRMRGRLSKILRVICTNIWQTCVNASANRAWRTRSAISKGANWTTSLKLRTWRPYCEPIQATPTAPRPTTPSSHNHPKKLTAWFSRPTKFIAARSSRLFRRSWRLIRRKSKEDLKGRLQQLLSSKKRLNEVKEVKIFYCNLILIGFLGTVWWFSTLGNVIAGALV